MKKIHLKDMVFDPSWEYEDPATGFFYRCGLIPGVLLYSELGGDIRANDAVHVDRVLGQAFSDGGFEGRPYCRVTDYTSVERASFQARSKYLKTVKRLNRQYDCNPYVTYICGSNTLMRTVLLFTEKIVKQNFVFTDTVEDALDHYNERRRTSQGFQATDESENERVSVSKKDIDTMLNLAGSLVWVDPGIEMPSLPQDHPLHSLYMALNTIKGDIVESKKRLQTSEERLGLVLSVANDGIWDWNLEDDSLLFDERYYTMAGYEPGDFPCAPDEWKGRMHPEDIEQTLLDVQNYLGGREPEFKVEFRFRRKDGEYMWILGRGKVVEWNEDGKARRFIGTHSDITKLKRAQEQLLKNLSDTERINRLMSGREERVVEMKREVNSLLAEMQREIRYKSVDDGSKVG